MPRCFLPHFLHKSTFFLHLFDRPCYSRYRWLINCQLLPAHTLPDNLPFNTCKNRKFIQMTQQRVLQCNWLSTWIHLFRRTLESKFLQTMLPARNNLWNSSWWLIINSLRQYVMLAISFGACMSIMPRRMWITAVVVVMLHQLNDDH